MVASRERSRSSEPQGVALPWAPFPLNLLGIPFALAERRRAGELRDRADAELGSAFEVDRMETLRQSGVDPSRLHPFTPGGPTYGDVASAVQRDPSQPSLEQIEYRTELQRPPIRQRISRLLSPDVIASDRFDAIMQGMGAGEDYTLAPGQRRFQGGNLVADNPALLTGVAQGGALADPRTGDVALERPDYRNVAEGSALVRTTDTGSPDVLLQRPKTYAPGSGGSGGAGKPPPRYTWQGKVYERQPDGQWREAFAVPGPAPTKLTVGQYEIERIPGAPGLNKAVDADATRLQDAQSADALLGALERMARNNPNLTGARGMATVALSTVRDVIADFTSPEEAADLAQRAQEAIELAAADPNVDPKVRIEASRFLQDPSTIGSMDALTFAAGYLLPRSYRESGRTAYQEIDTTRKSVDPRGRWSGQRAVESIGAQRRIVQNSMATVANRLAFQPGVTVRRNGQPIGGAQAPAQGPEIPPPGSVGPTAGPAPAVRSATEDDAAQAAQFLSQQLGREPTGAEVRQALEANGLRVD